MYEANKALTYFGLTSWDFQNENFVNLCRCLRLEDVRQFDFKDSLYLDKIQYVKQKFTEKMNLKIN